MGRKIPDAVLREAERLKRNRDIINEYGMHVEYLEKTKKLFSPDKNERTKAMTKKVKIPFRRYVIGKAVSDNKLTTVTENVVIRTITVHGLDGKIIQEIVDEYQEEED